MTVFGTTYSHKHAKYIGLDPILTFQELINLKIGLIRLCCYWDEIEPEKGTFDYSIIESLLRMSEETGQKTIVTVGMKAPRWPEFHIPKWLKDKPVSTIEGEVLYFIKRTIQQLKPYSCIAYWQVENEPLDPSGRNGNVIPETLLVQERKLINQLDQRETIVSLWGNELTRRNNLSSAKHIANNVGIDLYYRVPMKNLIKKVVYRGPKDTDMTLQNLVQKEKLWITELQAEPWEPGQLVPREAITPSFNTIILKQNIQRVYEMNPEILLLWGSEFWFWKAKNGDSRYLDIVKNIHQL